MILFSIIAHSIDLLFLHGIIATRLIEFYKVEERFQSPMKKSLSSLQDFLLVCFAGCREYLLDHMNNFNMDSKVPLLSPFNNPDWNPKMSAYLKRQCLFDVSIGALRT